MWYYFLVNAWGAFGVSDMAHVVGEQLGETATLWSSFRDATESCASRKEWCSMYLCPTGAETRILRNLHFSRLASTMAAVDRETISRQHPPCYGFRWGWVRHDHRPVGTVPLIPYRCETYRGSFSEWQTDKGESTRNQAPLQKLARTGDIVDFTLSTLFG